MLTLTSCTDAAGSGSSLEENKTTVVLKNNSLFKVYVYEHSLRLNKLCEIEAENLKTIESDFFETEKVHGKKSFI